MRAHVYGAILLVPLITGLALPGCGAAGDAEAEEATAVAAASDGMVAAPQEVALREAEVGRALDAMVEIMGYMLEHPELDDSGEEGEPTLAEVAAHIEKIPALKKILAERELTPQRYAQLAQAVSRAYAAQSVLDAGGSLESAPPELASVPASHLKYVREHRDQIDAAFARMAALDPDEQ